MRSVRAITDATGARVESAVYKPFGEQTETLSPANLTPESKGWIGERYDADAGLQYLNARYYDPVLGMFLQPDWFEVLKPGVGTNRFSYSFNDPVNFSDPSGHERISPKFSKIQNDVLTRTFEAIRSSLRKDVAAAGSLAARYDRGERTGWFVRLGWSSSEQRLHREVRRDQNCTSGTTCSAVTGSTFRQYGANVSTILAGIGSSGSGVKVEMGNGPRSPTGGIATAPRPGTSTTIYGDFFLDSVTSSNGLSVPQTDSTRIGYLVHEMGHAYLGLTDQLSRSGLASLGIGLGTPGVYPPFNDDAAMYDVYGATGRDAAIRLGVSNHNDRFICMTGLRGC